MLLACLLACLPEQSSACLDAALGLARAASRETTDRRRRNETANSTRLKRQAKGDESPNDERPAQRTWNPSRNRVKR